MNRKVYFAILLVVGGVGVLLMAASSKRLAKDQAGFAYIESSDGKTQLADGTRAEERTVVPDRKVEPDEEWLTKFSLIERSGKTLGSSDLSGQPYVAGFFFSTCPSVCVRQNEKVGSLQEKFRDKPIRFVSISVDPEVDRPEVLAQYAERFGADKNQWLFFTGDMDYIGRVGAEVFSLGVMRQGHPEKFALVDSVGKVYGLYTWSDPAQWLALQADMEKLINKAVK